MKRPIVDTFYFVKERLESLDSVSLRKQFCLQYLKCLVDVKKENKEELVELAKRWRKEDKKLGKHRSLLERKVRKLFPKFNKRKKLAPSRKGASEWCKDAMKNKVGVHSPEYKERMREVNRRLRQEQVERGFHPQALHWIVESPEGEIFKVYALRRFCEEHNLNHSHLSRSARVPGVHYKRWKARKYDPELEDF